MQVQQLERIYKGLKAGRRIDITSMAKEEMKEYEDGSKHDICITKMYLQMRGKTDPIITASLYRKGKLIENHWYYLDQLQGLKGLLNTWLNKI